MSDENLYEFLARRERELTHQIAGLKGQQAQLAGQLAQREHELREVRKLRETTGTAESTVPGRPQTNSNATLSLPTIPLGLVSGVVHPGDILAPQLGPAKPYTGMTIKQLAIQALVDHFPDGGTLVDIRDFIQDAYGRDIPPSSLRPQMHRLKSDGVLGQEPSTDTWNFRDGKRRQYAWYNHPSSRQAMKELQDSED